MKANGNKWGCVETGCDAHPANPANGGPIFRLSPKGEAFVGACGEHYAKHDAPVVPDRGWEVHEPDPFIPKSEVLRDPSTSPASHGGA